VSAYDSARYGKVVGDYDALYPGEPTENEAAVQLIAELAGTRPERSVLELGIGTGRIALALQECSLRVAGVEGSEQMIERLRAKPGGVDIDVVHGDYRDASAGGPFGLVLLTLNGIFDPRGLEAQLDIFRNAARHLPSGGHFVVESWVVSDAQRNGDWSVAPRFVGDEHVELQLARFDLEQNRIDRTLVHLRPEGLHFVTVTDTYASPGELDVMAHVTGFTRTARYADWGQAPFTVTSSRQISVFTLV
jgi:SAM-dependent methyltransferase